MTQFFHRRFPLLLFILLYLCWTFATFMDFGATFDESSVYVRGLALGHQLIHDDVPGMLVKSVPDDGLVIYDHLYGLILGFLNPSGNLDFYHLLNLLAALPLFIVLFEILLASTGNPWAATLGPVFLFLTPRFSGDLPGNPKDIPFATAYFLALAGIHLFLSRRPATPVLTQSLVLGFLFGLAQCARTLGFSLYLVFLLYDFHLFYHRGKQLWKHWARHLKETALLLGSVLILSNFMMMATWPYLGGNYVAHLLEAFHNSKNFFWNNAVLFEGKQVLASQLPLTYLPVWLGITLPLGLILLLVASFRFAERFIQNELSVLLVCALGVNAGLVILFHPVLYDGMRHFLFILPILAALAALSAASWIKEPTLSYFRPALFGLTALNLLNVGVEMVRLHPYEYIYFNEVPGGLRGSVGKFDNDYWGASTKEAVEWIKKNGLSDPKKTYLINSSGNNYQVFPYLNERMKWTDNLKDADYYLSTTRDGKDKLADSSKAIHTIERETVPLCYVFKLR